MKYAEIAPNNYSIEKKNICSIPLSVGLEDDIFKILSMSPQFLVKLWINRDKK